jgi:hypothetical protein
MIPCHSHLLRLLTPRTKKNIKFEWTTEHQQAFDALKNSLAREVVLAYLDFSVPIEIYTDASKYQIGSVITQKGKPLAFYSTDLQMRYIDASKYQIGSIITHKAKPLAFYSRKLTDLQMRYIVKLLAIVEMLHECKCILLGH